MSILQTASEFSGEANIYFNTRMDTCFITLGTFRDKIPCPSHTLVRITYDSLEEPIVFEASITKIGIRVTWKYFVKIILVPLRYQKLIPRGLKSIHYQLEIIPQA